ncbi:MAG: LptA/OstA family protein [Pseudomonadota bacterium]
MVVFIPDLRTQLRAALCAGLLLLPVLAQAASPRAAPRAADGSPASSAEYTLDGRDPQIDLRANTLQVSDVIISQGPIRIQAAKATAKGENKRFDNSRWEFSGDVRVRFQDGNLTADTAAVTIVGNRIVRATASGAPARFEHKLATMAQPALGRANDIDYDVPGNQVRLSGDVVFSFSNGRDEAKIASLVYDLSSQSAHSDNAPGDTDRVRMRFRPNETITEPAPPAAPTPAEQ